MLIESHLIYLRDSKIITEINGVEMKEEEIELQTPQHIKDYWVKERAKVRTLTYHSINT
jgi:hypothetical protein